MNKIFYFLGLLVLAAACSPSYTFSTDRDPGAKFTQYQTYYLADYNKFVSNADPRVNNDLNLQRVFGQIEERMNRLGYKRVERPEGAQLLVKIKVNIDKQSETQQQVNNNFYGYRTWNMYNPYLYPSVSTYQSNYEELSIMLDVVDAKQNALIWQGWGFVRLKSRVKDLQEAQSTVLSEILNEYPFPEEKKRKK